MKRFKFFPASADNAPTYAGPLIFHGPAPQTIMLQVVTMFCRGLMFVGLLIVTGACKNEQPKATAYREQLAKSESKPAPTPTPGAKPAPDSGKAPATATGNAQNGLAVLGSSCETAGCHKDNKINLTKATEVTITTGSKVAHKGVQPLFTAAAVADIKAALATR